MSLIWIKVAATQKLFHVIAQNQMCIRKLCLTRKLGSLRFLKLESGHCLQRQ